MCAKEESQLLWAPGSSRLSGYERAVYAHGTFPREPALQAGAERCFTVLVVSGG